MAGRQRVWFESFDLHTEITALIKRIESCAKFTLPDRKREIVVSYAAKKRNDTKQAHADANGARRLVSTSRRNFLTTIQNAILLTVPAENVALMLLTEYVLNDPSYYEDALHRAASLTEDEFFLTTRA